MIVFIMAVTVVFSGCGISREARIQQIRSQYPQWDQATVERVAAGRVEVGMTEEMVVEILGKPWQVAREGKRDVWTYMTHVTGAWGELRPVPAFFVYLEGGKVEEIRGDQRRVVTPLR
jgi:outer membrane protein assembly factor BamE (lipoprotein component of BamABCDE complex)